MEFNPGDKVKIIDKGRSFSTCISMAKSLGATLFESGYGYEFLQGDYKNGDFGRVVNRDRQYVLVKLDGKNREIVIGESGLEKAPRRRLFNRKAPGNYLHEELYREIVHDFVQIDKTADVLSIEDIQRCVDKLRNEELYSYWYNMHPMFYGMDFGNKGRESKKGMIMRLVEKAKEIALRVSNPDEAALRKAGIYQDDGSLTSQGQELLLSIVAELPEVKAKLVETAKAINAEKSSCDNC